MWSYCYIYFILLKQYSFPWLAWSSSLEVILSIQVQGFRMLMNVDEGAMIFPEMMAEMRRPMDFYKGMICAQILVSVVYLMYSVFCEDAPVDRHFVSLFGNANRVLLPRSIYAAKFLPGVRICSLYSH